MNDDLKRQSELVFEIVVGKELFGVLKKSETFEEFVLNRERSGIKCDSDFERLLWKEWEDVSVQ